MENIKAYKDGDRLFIVIDNCKESVEKVITDMLIGGLTALDTGLKPIKVAEEENIQMSGEAKSILPEPEYIFGTGKYKDMTPNEALQYDGYEAAMYIASVWTDIPEKNYTDIKKRIKEVCLKSLEKISESPDDFFTLFQSVFSEQFNSFFKRNQEVIKNMGLEATSLDDFIFTAPEKTVYDFAVCFLKK